MRIKSIARAFATDKLVAARNATLSAIITVSLVAGCSADSPTGVAESRIKALKPRAEHNVCIPAGLAYPATSADTVSMPASGTCGEGFDAIIWW